MKNSGPDETAVQLSIVVPIYDEEGNLGALLDALKSTMEKLDLSYELILVDDGSHDNSWAVIQAASSADFCVRGLRLSRNFGHQHAVFAGIQHCSGEAIVTMDGDLQHPPGTIVELVAAWRQGYKVVETRRIESADVSFMKKLTSRLFYRVFSWLSGLTMSPGTSDFRLVDAEVARTIKGMRDTDLFLRGITHWVGFPTTTVTYQAAERYAGQSKYGWSKMLRFALSSVLSFSTIPLKLGIWLGFLTSLLAFVEIVYVVVRYCQGESVPGWASTVAIMSFMFGVLFVLIGIIGVYLGSIFEIVKDRPQYIIQEKAGFSDS